MVEVSNKHKSITVSVSSNNGNTIVAASSDTSQYWANQSHTFADQAKESVQEAKNYAELANSYIAGFENVVTNNTNNIIATSNDCINQINTTKEEAVENVISAKTTILNDIEFVADGAKEEIEDLIDTGKDELKEAIGDVKILTTLKIGQIGIAPLGIDETLNMERYLNGQIIIQDQFKGFTQFLKRRIELYPSLACLEDEWQTTVTMSAFSQCGKFVIDDNAGTIRLPKVVNIQGLTDLSKLGEIVEAGLPNITGFSDWWSFGNGTNKPSGAFFVTSYANGTGSYGNSPAQLLSFDASRSNATYGNSDTVQPESIQYPYFIQVATGAETEDNITNTIELNNPFFLGMSQYFESEPNNLSWLKSAGQYNSKAVYTDYYDWLLKIYNGVEVVEGISVKLSTEEYTDYDFVLNTEDETFKLPLLDGSETIPDYLSGITIPFTKNTANYTAIKNCILRLGFFDEIYRCYINNKLVMDQVDTASGSNSQSNLFFLKKGDVFSTDVAGVEAIDIYNCIGNGSLYFYVGETVQNANLINAGRIEEKLVDKADRSEITPLKTSYITETYVNGTSWYRVWSDGWCEQGGQLTNSSNYIATITFLKSFQGTTYYFGGSLWNSANTNGGWEVLIQARYETGITVQRVHGSVNTNTLDVIWYACGYSK